MLVPLVTQDDSFVWECPFMNHKHICTGDPRLPARCTEWRGSCEDGRQGSPLSHAGCSSGSSLVDMVYGLCDRTGVSMILGSTPRSPSRNQIPTQRPSDQSTPFQAAGIFWGSCYPSYLVPLGPAQSRHIQCLPVPLLCLAPSPPCSSTFLVSLAPRCIW